MQETPGVSRLENENKSQCVATAKAAAKATAAPEMIELAQAATMTWPFENEIKKVLETQLHVFGGRVELVLTRTKLENLIGARKGPRQQMRMNIM